MIHETPETETSLENTPVSGQQPKNCLLGSWATGNCVSFDNMVCVWQTNRNSQVMGKGNRKIAHFFLVLWANTAWDSPLAVVVLGNVFSQPWWAGLRSSAGSWENGLFYSPPGLLRVLSGFFSVTTTKLFLLLFRKKIMETGLLYFLSSRQNDIDSKFGSAGKFKVQPQRLSYRLGKKMGQNKANWSRTLQRWCLLVWEPSGSGASAGLKERQAARCHEGSEN